MIYGNTQGNRLTNTANFGASAFSYDARQILTDNAIDATDLILGWGDANDNQTPVISGQVEVTVNEDEDLTLSLAHINATDPNNRRGGLNLNTAAGTNYSLNGLTLTPAQDYDGRLIVPVTVDDGQFTSREFDLLVKVLPVNDKPIITGQNPLSTLEDTPIALTLNQLVVTDVDNNFPSGFTLSISDGPDYSVSGSVITPDPDFSGDLRQSVASLMSQLIIGKRDLRPVLARWDCWTTIRLTAAICSDRSCTVTAGLGRAK